MIYAEKGKEQECFIDFVEKALGILPKEKYRDFLAVFDNSRILTEQELISALHGSVGRTRQLPVGNVGRHLGNQ